MKRYSVVVLLGVVLLAGCADNDPGEEASPSADTSSEVSESGAVSVDLGPGDQPWSEDPEVNRQRTLAVLAEFYGLEEVPEVAVVRYISPAEEAEVLESCMLEQGFPKVDGGWRSDSDDQDAAMDLAMYTCSARYPYADRYLVAPADGWQGLLYDHYLAEIVPCFEGQGYPVTDIPTRERFVATVGTSEEWMPTPPANLGFSESVALQEACPMTLPWDAMWPAQ